KMLPGYSVKNFNYTTGLAGSRDFYWGIGLQARVWNDWKATIALSQMFIGGGFRYALDPIPSLRVKTYGISLNSEITNAFTLNVEKKLWRSKDLNIKNIGLSTEVNLLGGVGVYWIPPADRVVDTLMKKSSNGIERQTIFIPKNNVSGMVNVGLTNQFYINNRPSLKLGVMYSYGLTPSREFQYKINYFYDDNPHENFNVVTGKHRLLVYLEYPIVLYRNKAQKES